MSDTLVHTISQRRPEPLRRSSRVRRRIPLALAGAALALLVSAAPAAAWSAQYSFLITGHGWGHGIGMSQWGAYGYAKHGYGYRTILRHYYTGISLPTLSNRYVTVKLNSGLGSVKVTCPHAYTVRGSGNPATIAAGKIATTTWTGSAYRVVAGGVTRTFSSAVTFAPSTGALRILTATDLGDTGAYRGTIKVAHGSSGLTMLNHVGIDSYVRGVVPHEVSPSWPADALKVQACAARAFGLASRQPINVIGQAYVGVGIEDPRTDAAVRATAGVTPSYGGKPIYAFYSSCSGGHTESIQYGWPGSSPIAYLKGVADPYDYYASLHDWGPLRRTSSQIGGPLASRGSCRAVVPVKRGTSPRIVKAAILGSSGTKYMDGNTLRMKLNLKSTWANFVSLSISPAPRDGATITNGQSLTIRGRTYPAMAAGAVIKLYFSYGGQTHSRNLTTTRVTENLPNGYTARYSAYSGKISPSQTTKYWVLRGSLKSAVTTVTVK